MTTTTDGEIHGGLLVSLRDVQAMEPIQFPFWGDGVNLRYGNQLDEFHAVHSASILEPFNFWHASRNASKNEMYVAERGINVDGRMVGQNSEEVLRKTLHHIITMNAGLRREERSDMLEMVTNTVMPNLQTPAMISVEMQSSQPKFLLFSRDIPIHVNVFCDDTCMLLMWSNENNIEQRMHEHYGNRFVVYRMPPIVNSACVIQTYFLRKKIKRWRFEMRNDNLRILNALEAFIFRRSKQDNQE